MNRFLLPLCAISALAAAATAQCYETNYGVLCPNPSGPAGYGDDVLFTLQPMNFAFPMAGVAASYTHAHICSNGVIYLTNGAASGGTTYAYNPVTTLFGTAGQPPRIAPLWIDLDNEPQYNGGVFFNNTIPGKFVVTWLNTVEWASQGTTPVFTVQAQLFANGDVTFYYSPSTFGMTTGFTPQFVSRVGISEGNGIVGPAAVDLSLGNVNLTNFTMYEDFPINVFDLNGTSVNFIYAGTGYIETDGACIAGAFHQSYGHGCYDISDSFYQYLPTAATAPATLNGQSMVMTPVGSQYAVTWGGATYAPPTGATVIALTDDGEAAQTLSAPFPTPAGPVGSLYVGANGIVSVATNPTASNYVPDANTFLNSPVTAWYSWHDYNPGEAGSGQVKYHEAVVGTETIAYITWDGVENYSTPAALNPSTLQFQFSLTTGRVSIVWVTIDSQTTSAYGTGHLIGYSPGGSSSNSGSINLATALPLVTSGNYFAMALACTPTPVSTPSSGTLLTYTTTNMFEYAPSAGVYIGMNILSLGQFPTGLDLGIIGAPGCKAYVSSLDLTQTMVGFTSTNTVTFPLPAGVPQGFQLYSQSVGLVTPFSLPNGQNAFGLAVSNGLRSSVWTF
jgi:hypothetical protein